MAKRIIERIRDSIRTGEWDFTFHAIEEMAENQIGISDVEKAVLDGKVIKTEKDDPRGTKYIVMGKSGSCPIAVAGRFKETGVFLIITVYKIN